MADNSDRSIGALAPGKQDQDGAELRKPHEMIVMIPRSSRVTLTGRRVYNALMQVSQSQMASMDAMPAADYMFEAPLSALLKTCGSTGEDRTAAKRYLMEMRGLQVDWESTAPGDGVKWRGFAMLSEVAIEVRNGQNWVAWSYPPTIMTALRDPVRWARIGLDALSNLSGYTAVALYEICARYRDNPSGLTSRKPCAWWSDALSSNPPGSERREWRKFKSERVKPAIAEINAETDLEIELIEHKRGKLVEEVQFSVRKKRSLPKASKKDDLVDANLVLRAESLGIREIKFEGLLKEFGEPAVRTNLAVLEGRVVNSRLKGVENRYSYLRALLRNESVSELESESTQEAPRPERAPETSLKSAASIFPSQPLGLKPADSEQKSFLESRFDDAKEEIRALSTEQQKGLVEEALAELQERGLLTAVVRRRAGQGDVLHGILGSVIVKIYATRLYGPDWDKPESGDLFSR